MPVKPNFNPDYLYFVTTTVVNRTHLFKKEKEQEFKVWEDGYDARDVFSVEFLEQKMNYIHYNPCQPQWKLVDLPEEYLWSSARFYLANMPAIIPVDDARDLFV